MIKCPHCNKSKNREYNYIRIQTFIVCMISPLFWLICRHSLLKPFTKRTVYPSITPTFFIFASSNIIILIPMAANNQKNTRILLFLLLCIRMTLTVDANDFLFTSINTDTLHTPTPRRKNGIHHQRECQSVWRRTFQLPSPHSRRRFPAETVWRMLPYLSMRRFTPMD